ncbi:MAG: DUF3604 domain-containing protein [Halioglobus sp.]|nr:DUF3604 domain-containing protein [Halioglobus sp.]
MRRALLVILALIATNIQAAERQLLWGDTHLHTMYSSDAYTNNNTSAGPDTAFRYARGVPVIHPYHGARVQIGTPLDFLVVSDHAEFLGQIRNIHVNGVDTAGLGPIDSLIARVSAWWLNRTIDSGDGRELFVRVLPDPNLTPQQDAEQSTLENSDLSVLPMPKQVEIDVWRTITDVAEKYNEPGQFTALIGWEWSAIPAGANLHRIVITDSDAETAQQYDPFGLDDSPYPEDLWAWLEETSQATGARFTAIPHNSNISKGYMFSDRSLRGEAFDADYMAKRSKWERIAEITQIKGDSETHASLSPNDEFADFENYPYYIQRYAAPYEPQRGDFVREALKQGLELDGARGQNPYMLGVIGSTDAHTSVSSAEENNFHGKLATDSIPSNKQNRFREDEGTGPSGWSMSASGLAGVWAESNTRAGIMDALQRRSVYATTGPRIVVEFFGGTDFVMEDLDSAVQHAAMRQRGTPMGGELTGPGVPTFAVMAARDPQDANLDRIQIVKGWLNAQGEAEEKVYNVAWSGERQLNPDGRLPPVGNTVDLTTGQVDNSIGAAELSTVWTDPDFDPSLPAFYYVRVLQIPTARHSLLDALALGLDTAEGYPDTIQERAYTSAIWFHPAPVET